MANVFGNSVVEKTSIVIRTIASLLWHFVNLNHFITDVDQIYKTLLNITQHNRKINSLK